MRSCDEAQRPVAQDRVGRSVGRLMRRRNQDDHDSQLKDNLIR